MLDRLRERAERFLEARAREQHELSLSVLRESRLGALHADAERLFGLEQISAVQRELAGATGPMEKRLRFLLAFLVEGRAASVAAPELDQRLTWQGYGSVGIGERTVSVRQAPAAIATEADPMRRRRIAEAYHVALAEHEELAAVLLGHWREVAGELGYGPYVETWQLLQGTDLRALARDGARFLGDSDPLYRELLAWFLPRLAGVEVADATAGDLERLRQAAPYDLRFAAARVPDDVLAGLAAMGLDPTAAGRLSVEVQPSLTDARGARVHALRVPEAVVVPVMPAGGARFHAALLQSLGYGLHRACTDAALPMELRWLGDEATSLGYGALLRGLRGAPAWLDRVYGVPRPERPELRRLGVLLDLLRARTAVAQLQFELAYHDGTDRAHDAYVQCFDAALHARHDRRAALWSAGLRFRSASRLRGEQFGAVLALHLRDRCDEDWFRNPRSGPLLAELFASGRSYTAAELSVQLASAPLAFGPLLERAGEGGR